MGICKELFEKGYRFLVWDSEGNRFQAKKDDKRRKILADGRVISKYEFIAQGWDSLLLKKGDFNEHRN